MLIDGRELPAGSDLRADVCVVGAGPAGITLAIELGRAGVDVLLLESGGITRERGADRLRDGHSVGYPMSVARTRARGVGGSSLAWLPSNSLRARPLDPIDFESREGVPHSGWPFGRAHLDSYYERAHIYAGMGPYRYDVDYWSEPPNAMPIELTDGDVGTTIFQFGEPDRWRSYLTDLTASGHIRLVTHATVLEVCTEDVPNMVSRLRVRASADGQEFYASGRRYVLALGGLENPRLLLASDRIHKRGVGNAHDLVGRFFMEHLSCDTGRLRPADQGLVHRLDLYRQRHVSHGHPIQGMITVSEQAVRKHGLRNATFWVHPADEHWLRPGVRSARVLLSALRRRPLMPGMLPHLRTIARDPWSVARVAYAELRRRRPAPSALTFRALAEQAPNPSSRVSLSKRRDRFGLRQLRVDWRISDDDLASISRHQEILERAFASSGIGELTAKLGGERPAPLMIGNAHHMGTTRMHRDQRQGVVDEHGRIHGLANLFVAGSSVFPTSGYANPTLTIVALALRLADHLHRGGGT